MASRVVMPKLSDTMEEGKILRWLKQEGDRVETGQTLAEVETDKATVEMEAYTNGVIRKIVTAPGETVKIGALIAVIGTPDEDIASLLEAASAGRSSSAGRRPEPRARAERRPSLRSLARRREPKPSPPRLEAAAAASRQPRPRRRRPRPPRLAARASHGRRVGHRPRHAPGHRAAGPRHQARHRGRARPPPPRRRRAACPAGRRRPGDRAVVDAADDRQAPGPEQGARPPLLPDGGRRGRSPVGGVPRAARGELPDLAQRRDHQGRGAWRCAGTRR